MGYQKKYKKFVATAATATLVASAIVPVASAKSFSDVAENNEFQPFIDALSDAGIINGYQDGTFKPGNKLTRGQVVKMLGRWVEANGQEIPADWNSVQRFNDVPTNSADEELVKYAALVKDAGVFTGSNGNLMAGNNITRQQMAKVLNGAYTAINGFSLVDLADSIDNKLVTDLASAQQEFEGYIQALVDLEISTVSVFRPTENVTRAQFAKFLYNTINLEVVDAVGVKAINNTTVEVTFEDAIGDIAALDFTIEGLEVKNAVVKQSDAKTAVLTTAAQEANKTYKVSVDGKEVGSFKGITAVVPTSVTIVEQSLQAPVGTQVTLKAQVTVKEGESKEGIPVTFNIVNSASINTATLNQPIVVEATTNADGVATYTYTRYAQTSYQIASHDEVQAYATGNPTVRSFSKVYWASIQPLALTEVAQGNEIQNGGKKVYKVTAAKEHAEWISKEEIAKDVNGYKAKGVVTEGYYVNVGFKENTNVTPDKAVKTVDVIDANGNNLSYPGQYTSSVAGQNSLNNWVKEVKIKLDSAGQAIFTLSGYDATVTPYVFVDQKVNPQNSLGSVGRNEATELISTAAPVVFKKQHTLVSTLDAIGEQYAAAFYDGDHIATPTYKGDKIANRIAEVLTTTHENVLNVNGTQTTKSIKASGVLSTAALENALVDAGGRDYKITVKNNNGTFAPKGTKVGIQLEIGTVYNKTATGGAVYLVDNNTKRIFEITTDAVKAGKYVDFNLLTTDANGQVSFTLIGAQDAYVTPTLLIDSGNKQNEVDSNDQKIAGEIVYFSDARVAKANLVATKSTAAAQNEVVEFVYQTVDQNGKPYRPATNNLDVTNNAYKNIVPVTFQVSTTFNKVLLKPGQFGTGFYNNSNSQLIVGQDSMGNFSGLYETVTMLTDEFGKASIAVEGQGLGTTVNVTASTSIASLPQTLTASTQFVSSTAVPAQHTNTVASVNVDEKELKFNGKDAISYKNAKFFTKVGKATAEEIKEADFIEALRGAYGAVVVTRSLQADGTNHFTIEQINASGDKPQFVQSVFTSSTVNVTNDVNTLGLVGTTATSSNTSVASTTVANGAVGITSVAPGTAVITVKDADPATTDATINVTVSATGAITYTINKAGAVQVGTQTVGQYVTTALNVNAFGEFAIAIPQASLTGDLQGATAVKLTVKGTDYIGTLTSGYFVFAVPTTAATEADVKAGILTKTN